MANFKLPILYHKMWTWEKMYKIGSHGQVQAGFSTPQSFLHCKDEDSEAQTEPLAQNTQQSDSKICTLAHHASLSVSKR